MKKMKHLISILCFWGCTLCAYADVWRVGLSADYPPMEFYTPDGDIQGLDVDVIQAIAADLGYTVQIQDMAFSSLFMALKSGRIDVAISSISATPERAQNFSFSDTYNQAELAILENKDGKHEGPWGAQTGSVMATWAEEKYGAENMVFMPTNLPLVESLKAGRLQGVVLETDQARAFAQKNPQLTFRVLGEAQTGYVIALKKGSEQLEPINQALKRLKDQGTLEKIRQKWFNDSRHKEENL